MWGMIVVAVLMVAGGVGCGGGGAGGAGGAGGSGSTDPCQPDCLGKLMGGCTGEGTCMAAGSGLLCWSNGVTIQSSGAGSSAMSTISKNGMVCATLEGGTYRDAAGVALGTTALSADGSQTIITCNGESPVALPSNCGFPCLSGNCP
jgi:hypothetical protein